MATNGRVLREWGVVLVSDRTPMLLGDGWFEPSEPWPKRFRTRREARVAAKVLTDNHQYLRPALVWRFSSVRLRITVKWGTNA